MRTGLRLAACTMALALTGCISITDSPTFAVPVAASQIVDIPQPAAISALAAQAPSPAAAPEKPAPARTDVRGAGDGAAVNPNRVVASVEVKELEHKVADFSPEQVASMVCRAQGSQNPKHIARGVRAWEASVALFEARTAYNAGRIPLRDYNQAERARQDAMLAFRGDGWLESLFGARFKKSDLPKPEDGDLILENIDLFTFTENGASVMAISGTVRNRGKLALDVPPVTLQAIDQWDWLLAGQTSLLPFETLAPGEARTFELRFLNPPESLAEVYAHFAPPFEYRARRNCPDDFDPRQAHPIDPALGPNGAASLPPSIHSAAELNELARFYREQAENAWICRNGEDGVKDRGPGLRVAVNGSGERREGGYIMLGTPDLGRVCASWQERLRWRDMFGLAEAADEAWAELRAREASPTPAPNPEPDAALPAYDRLKLLGQAALARTGGSSSGIAVDLAATEFSFEKGSNWLTVSGRLRNTGSEPARADALMLAVVDRLDLPMLTLSVPNPATLAPGEAVQFTHRLRLNVRPPTTGKWGTSPGWQLRVGAVAAPPSR